jgi:putative endonuclease
MKQAGAQAEQRALDLLLAGGVKLQARNYRCRAGEIDLIVTDGATLVFVEVRMRSRGGFGSAAESITARKQGRIIAAAQHYLASKRPPACRFDAVVIDGDAEPVWIKDAFSA